MSWEFTLLILSCGNRKGTIFGFQLRVPPVCEGDAEPPLEQIPFKKCFAFQKADLLGVCQGAWE